MKSPACFGIISCNFSVNSFLVLFQVWKLESKQIEKIGAHHHVFSHIEWDMVGYKIQLSIKLVKSLFLAIHIFCNGHFSHRGSPFGIC